MSLFITGSTGFLGTGLLYLLDEKKYQHPIYLLIRNKKQSASDRFKEMQTIFPLLQLHLIETELSSISKLDLRVDYIINCAASINFNLELKDATQQNVDGLLELIQFARNNNILHFIHISTAYVSEYGKDADEKFVNMDVFGSIGELYAKIKSDDITFDEIINKKYFPNTYCFTKCLAEKIIEREAKNNNIFFQIIRPSIITNSVKTPYPGWFKGYGATIGVHKLVLSELLNVLICNKDTKMDYIPVDHVANLIYQSLNKKPTKQYYLIKHSTSYFTPTVEEMYAFLKEKNVNIHIYDKKNITYYFYKYYNLLKIIIMIVFNYLLSYVYKEKIRTAKKWIKVLGTVDSVQDNFNNFLHNTYYFKSKSKSKPKKKNHINTNEYYDIMINSIKNSS